MKWIGLLTISTAAYVATVTADCQPNLGGNCGDSSRPRDQNCCQVGYCQPWNSGYYQCITAPAKCPTQETDIDYAGNDIKTVYGLQPSQCCDTCAATANCKAYTFVNQNPDGKTACYLKTSSAGRVEKKGAVSAELVITTPPPPPPNCPVQEVDTDYYGNDLKTVNSVTQAQCCDACGSTDKCVGYSYVPSTSSCYLKSSTAGKVAKSGVISGQVTTKPPPPPPNCPLQEIDTDYYGNDLKTVNSVTQAQCCDACGTTDKCVGYSYVPSTKSCYLKSSTAGKVAKTGVISGQLPATPPPPPNCPVQEVNVDYYGNDIKTVNSVTQAQCCDACGTTDKCVGYSYVPSTSSCYLKSSTAGKVSKAGVISGQVTITTPPPPPNCPVQELNTDYYGNDLKTVNGVSQSECCDSCGTTTNCVAYSYVASTKSCYLKSSTAGRVTKAGVVSGQIKYIPPPPNCPTQELNIDYVDNDIKSVRGVTYGGCCDACGATSGCRAFVYVEQNPDGKSACYLKSAAGTKVTKTGAIAGLYNCPTPVLGSCGSSSTGPLCCPAGSFCEPWNPGYYQCIPVPDAAKCPKVLTGVDFYGGDIDVQYGLLPGTCCDACNANKDCTVFTFVNDAPGGKSACYLKNKVVEQRAKANAVSGYKAA